MKYKDFLSKFVGMTGRLNRINTDPLVMFVIGELRYFDKILAVEDDYVIVQRDPGLQEAYPITAFAIRSLNIEDPLI